MDCKLIHEVPPELASLSYWREDDNWHEHVHDVVLGMLTNTGPYANGCTVCMNRGIDITQYCDQKEHEMTVSFTTFPMSVEEFMQKTMDYHEGCDEQKVVYFEYLGLKVPTQKINVTIQVEVKGINLSDSDLAEKADEVYSSVDNYLDGEWLESIDLMGWVRISD